MNRTTVIRHIKTLVKNGYVIDKTPNLRNHPHTYKVSEKIFGVANNDSTVAINDSTDVIPNNTVVNSDLKIQDIRDKSNIELIPAKAGNDFEKKNKRKGYLIDWDSDGEEAHGEDEVFANPIDETQEENNAPVTNHKNWEESENQFQKLILMIGEAKYFKPGEKKRLTAIEERKDYLYNLNAGDKALYPDFVKVIVDWALKMNRGSLKISVANILSALENEDRFNEFVISYKKKLALKEKRNKSKRGW